MKTLKSLLPFVLAVFALAGCKTDDLEKDIDALTDRVNSLEAQVSLLNDNLNALRVFMDGGVTISKVDKTDTEPITYTLTLSNSEVITLTQGSMGSVVTPEITINENNEWVINGVPTGVVANGNDGKTPQFRVNGSGIWEMNLGDEWTVVKDENGEDAKATTSETIETGDQFFEEVEQTTENGIEVIKVKLFGDDNYYSLPIVEDLLCEIVEPTAEEGFDGSVWTIGYGETVTAAVKVKGENYIVTAPESWVATVEVINEETGEGTLTVTAPTQDQVSTMSRAAVADNTTDLVLQVNKGITWAVDKIQVKAAKVVTSYYEEFKAGKTLTFSDYELKRDDWTESENFVIKQIASAEDITKQGIYFVKPGVTVSWNNSGAIKNTFIIGDDPRVQTATLDFKQSVKLNAGNGDDAQGTFIFANIKVNALNSSYSMTSNGRMTNLIFDKCKFSLEPSKRFYNGSGIEAYRQIDNIKVVNSIFDFTGYNTQQFFNTATAGGSNITIENNVFYAKEQVSAKSMFAYVGDGSVCNSVTLKNNTFVNVAVGTNGVVNVKTLNRVDIENNLFSLESYSAYQIVVRYLNDDTDKNKTPLPENLSGTVLNNICNAESGWATQTWKALNNDNLFDGSQQITRKEQHLFETCDFDNLIFVPKADYAAYGAKFE